METSSSKASDREPRTDGGGLPPACTILAGPNGSGKSSIFELLRPDGEFVNADVLARALGLGDAQAARRTIARLDALLQQRQSFVYETTLSSHHALSVMRRARDLGYEVGLVFVTLVSADLNVNRVAQRVSRGGHDIPEVVVRRRYPRAFANLAKAMPLSHGCLIYDNSEPKPELLLRVSGETIEENHLDEKYAHHHAIARAVAQAFDVETEAVFGSAGRVAP